MPGVRNERSRVTTPAPRWHSFHFSGKVILSSVIFGLCFVLVGGVVFAIPFDAESNSKNPHGEDDITAKPPSTFVGPVMMGIGGFAVVSGTIMCCFETQLCRKRNSESNPLVSESSTNSQTSDSEPIDTPKSKRHHCKKHPGHKKATPPKSTKTREAARKRDAVAINMNDENLSSSVESVVTPKEETPEESHFSSPIAIEESGKFQSGSGETFLTPPDADVEYPPDYIPETSEKVHPESKNANLEQSSEFQTPSTSFVDKTEVSSLQENIRNMKEEKQETPEDAEIVESSEKESTLEVSLETEEEVKDDATP